MMPSRFKRLLDELEGNYLEAKALVIRMMNNRGFDKTAWFFASPLDMSFAIREAMQPQWMDDFDGLYQWLDFSFWMGNPSKEATNSIVDFLIERGYEVDIHRGKKAKAELTTTVVSLKVTTGRK